METEEGLESQALGFAQRLENLMTGVFGLRDDPYTADPEAKESADSIKVIIQSFPREGIPLCCDGLTVLRLDYTYKCSCRTDHAYLQVDDSEITLRVENERTPIMHYDYVRNPIGGIPAAHINVHASNDSATRVMLACGKRTRGKQRRQEFVEKGVFPTFSMLHFPVGGDRLRPGLEDVLQMAVIEFGIDTADDWRTVIEDSRAEYRTRQIRALVDEFPDIAYDALIRHGHDLTERPTRPDRTGRVDNLTRF